MWVIRVERVQGDYVEPEIIDLEDGRVYRLHESDVSEDGAKQLADLFTEQAKCWARRPPGAPLGPVIHVRWNCVPNLPDPIAIGVDDGPNTITYTVDASLISQRAADRIARLDTDTSPYWQRVHEGYHDDGEDGAE